MATFSPRPTEFEFPWFDTRNTYDQSLETAITANETAAGLADAKAVAAQGTADQAVLDADAAQTRADLGVANAALAQATADAALPVHLPPAAGTNLNTLTAVGVHPVPWLTGTLALNFPIASTAGIVEVLPYDGVKLIQRFTPTTGTVAQRGTWSRRRTDTSTWGAWVFQPTLRIDTTVGTRIFVTDGVTEHMIKGDTLNRNVTDLLTEGWAAVSNQHPTLRREGNSVTLRAYLTRGVSAVALNIPPGFRPDVTHVQGAFYGLGTPAEQVGVELTTTARFLGSSTGTHYCYFRWNTRDAWPTTLPGTPA